ncbi:AmmeMemoRadiSam system protein B, partial [Candidatus Micrarchaeota archaeon]|nr:AmmeMemoRadiSam system protein B [Candidatus Micrarchaeota archaeon]
MSREATVAGSFYPSNPTQLKGILKEFFSNVKKEKEKTNSIIAPHAGYIYSGRTAAYSYSALKELDCFILIGPNHTGFGKEVSVYPEGEWSTPLGEMKVDGKIGKKITEKMENASFDEEAHLQEHSLEVQIPFIQFLFGEKAKIVPITLMTEDLSVLEELGKAIYEIEKEEGREIGVIASSDFNHFVPEETAKEKDGRAIERITEMDIKGFNELVEREQMSICGHRAIEALMY